MSSLESTLRIFPRLPLGTHRSWRLVERNLTSSRDGWLVVVSGFFEPLFYLLALGVGVGALVGSVDLGGESVSYREFVAPALLAASAMNGAVYESGNVFFKLKYAKTYDGVLATPMTVRDVALGELTYTLIRGVVYSFGFVTVMLAMGLLDSPWAVFAIPGALLVSAAFAAPSVYGITWMRSWADFAFVELCTLPMFLFSATFVAADTYPDVVGWLLPLTPLYHGVELLRAFTLGDVTWLVLVNIAYLVALTGMGMLATTGVVLGRLAVSHGGRVCHSEIRRGDYEAAGAVPQDSEDLIDYTRRVAGVEVGLLFMEQPRGGVKVSLRSRKVDVAKVAEKFGGGGHRLASGCTLDTTLEETRQRVLAAVAAALDASS